MSNIGGIEIDGRDPSQIFEFESKVGEGSYGAVYKAIDRTNGKTVAVKVLDLQGDTNQIQDLQREINILKTCACQQIVEYCGAYSKDGQLWIAMEFCGAGSLSDLMAICDTILDEDEIAAIMFECLKGLEYLHKNKKIHRDIKSGNILLTDDGRCKLADFGVSAELTATLAKTATMIGTPYFMAPEVLTNSQYDAKADIWSVGITAFELAMGQPPLADVHPMRAIFQIPNSPPPQLPTDQGFSDEFHEFMNCCLQKDPKDRWSAEELQSLPFFKMVRGNRVDQNGYTPTQLAIQDLLSRCKDMIDSWREQDAAEQMEAGQHNPYAPREQQGDVDPSSGTCLIHNQPSELYIEETGTMRRTDLADAHHLQQQYSGGYNDGTVVIKSPKQQIQQNQDDYGTVVIKKQPVQQQQQQQDQHFGSLKMGNKGTIVNNSGTMVTRPNTNAPSNLSFAQYNDVAQRVTSKAQAEDLKKQLQAARAQDLKFLNAFYDQKLQEIDQVAARK